MCERETRSGSIAQTLVEASQMTLYKKKRRKLAVWLIVSASLALSSSAYPEQEDEPEMEATEVGVLWGEPELIDNTLHARAKTNKPPPDILRMKFPECSEECRPEMHGDGWCQDVCATVECGNDGKDCDGWCAPDCKPSWVGDGFCDNDCYVEACEFDKHDCDGRRTSKRHRHGLMLLEMELGRCIGLDVCVSKSNDCVSMQRFYRLCPPNPKGNP